jgi:hypothetical protein
MLKKISAALLVASIFAAPAMAAGTVKTDVAPITKPVQSTPKVANTKALNAKVLDAKVLDAKASMHGVRHGRHHIRHHRFHKHTAVFKKHTVAHVVKAKPIVKRMSSAKPVAAKTKG